MAMVGVGDCSLQADLRLGQMPWSEGWQPPVVHLLYELGDLS